MPTLVLNPTKIRELFADLVIREANSRLYNEIEQWADKVDISAESKHSLPPGYHLLRVDGRLGKLKPDGFEIVLVNELTKTVVYYNKVLFSGQLDMNCRPATQVLVWRSTDSRHAAVLHGLAQDVFFNYILDRYDIILSDNYQTSEGQYFWMRQMSNALTLNYHVYYYRLMESKLDPIPDQDSLDGLTDQIWSEDDGQTYHLAVISKIKLPAELKVEVQE